MPKKYHSKKQGHDEKSCKQGLFYIYPIPPIYIIGRGCCMEECRPVTANYNDNTHNHENQHHEESPIEHERPKKVFFQRPEYNSTEEEKCIKKKKDEDDPNRYDNFYNNYNIDWHSAGVSKEDEEDRNADC